MNRYNITRSPSSPALRTPRKDSVPLTRSKSTGDVAGTFKPETTGEPQKLDQPNASQLQPQKQTQTLHDPTAKVLADATTEDGLSFLGVDNPEWDIVLCDPGPNETGPVALSERIPPSESQPANAAHADQNPAETAAETAAETTAETPLPIRRAATQKPDTPDASDYLDEASLDTPPVAADDLKVANDRVAESSAALEANKKVIEQETKLVAFMVSMQKFVDGLLTQYPNLTAADLAPLRNLFDDALQVCQQQLQQKIQDGQTISRSLSQHVAEATRLSELARGGHARPDDTVPSPVNAQTRASTQHALARLPAAERAILESGMVVAQKVVANATALSPEAHLIDSEQNLADDQRRMDDNRQLERSLAELESFGKRAEALDADIAQMLNASPQDEPMPTLDNWPALNADSAPKEKSAAEMSVGELASLAIQRNAAAKVHGNSLTAEAASTREDAEKELQNPRAVGDRKTQAIRDNMTK